MFWLRISLLCRAALCCAPGCQHCHCHPNRRGCASVRLVDCYHHHQWVHGCQPNQHAVQRLCSHRVQHQDSGGQHVHLVGSLACVPACGLGWWRLWLAVGFGSRQGLCRGPKLVVLSGLCCAQRRPDFEQLHPVCSALCGRSASGGWGPVFITVACAATAVAAACRVLENTGGGTGLTTTPDKELVIPFTTTATQTLQSSAGWVSGSVSITNTAQVAITLTSFTVDLGSGGVSQPVSQCQTPTVAVGSATGCAFNVSAPSAPAAGSVTATVDYSLTTTTGASTASGTSAATPYSFTGGCGCDASWAAGSMGALNSKVLCDVLLPV